MPAPLCFLTLEFTAKVKNPVDVPDIIQSSILTRIKKCRTSSIEQVQYLYNAEESYWKPKKQVTEEATQYHGITNEDLLTQDSINGLKIKNYVVYWANVYTFRILQKSKVKFFNHRFIFLNNLINVIGEDGSLPMTEWARLASAASGNNEFPEEILTNTNNKVICLTVIFDYISEKLTSLYGLDLNKHYDLVAAVQYNSAIKAKSQKSLKVHKLMRDDFNEFKLLLDKGMEIKRIKKEYFINNNYLP